MTRLGHKPDAREVRGRVAAKERKWNDGTTVLRVFRRMFDGARADGCTVPDAAVTAGLGTAVFMALTRVQFAEEPENEHWDKALGLVVGRLVPQLEPDVLRAAVEEVQADA